MRPMSRAKYSSTAASVPNWVTAVKDAPASVPKKISDTMRRCPDEEIGRNSVRPCTAPRTIACSQVMASPITRGTPSHSRNGQYRG